MFGATNRVSEPILTYVRAQSIPFMFRATNRASKSSLTYVRALLESTRHLLELDSSSIEFSIYMSELESTLEPVVRAQSSPNFFIHERNFPVDINSNFPA